MIHVRKCWPVQFEELRLSVRTYEVRSEVGGPGPVYGAGDILRLREFDHMTHGYSGRALDLQVVHATALYRTPPEWEIRGGLVVVMGVIVIREFRWDDHKDAGWPIGEDDA